MPRQGTAARKRAREGKPPVKPGKPSWVYSTKLAFFTAYKEDFIAAAEIKETGAFYTRIAKLYLKKYGYNTAWDEDLEEGQDTADDIDEDEDVDTLLPEVAEARSAYYTKLRNKIAVWYHAQYGGNVRQKQVPKTFKQLFDKAELEPSEPTRKRELHYYSTNFYAERIKPRFITRWAAVTRAAAERGEKPPAEVAVRQQVTKEMWSAETPAFRAEISKTIDKIHEAAIETYKVALANDTPSTAEEYSIALNNAAFYLTPFAEAAQQQFGMNVSILLCGPVPDRGGRIEVRSVHAGFSNGLVPRIWSDFDRGGFDAVQRSFVNFAHHCFTEPEPQATVLMSTLPVPPLTPTPPIPYPLPLLHPVLPTPTLTLDLAAMPGTPTPTPTPNPTAAAAAPHTRTPTHNADPDAILFPIPSFRNPSYEMSEEDGNTLFPMWEMDVQDAGYTGPVVGAALRWEMTLMSPAECMEYMGQLARMSPEMLSMANERAEARRRVERASNEAAAAAAERASNGAVAAEHVPDMAAAEHAPDKAAAEHAPDKAAAEAAVVVERARPKPKPAWRRAQSSVDMALERPDTHGEEENEGQGNGEGGWKSVWKNHNESGWPQELTNAVRAFERGKTWGGPEWKSCVADFIALERASGYPVKGDVLAPQGEKNVRPEEIPTFMQRRRKWEKQVTLSSGIGPASAQGSFADRWWAWWMRAQPAARLQTNRKLGPADAIPVEEWNGLLLYMGGLLWWGEAAAAAPDSTLLEDWRVAVLDMSCVLRVAVAAKKSGTNLDTEEENEAAVEPSTRTKRKRPENGGDDKENEGPPKKRRGARRCTASVRFVLGNSEIIKIRLGGVYTSDLKFLKNGRIGDDTGAGTAEIWDFSAATQMG
ncbi:hypothetical protein B0H14DRAFT_2562359 [Mycena olivaceomarginata]|nr:hypothetical protein B0H14DRAFT_2562359 [Mycena olivaceomarginata]